jgi:outer membrane protein
VAILGVALPVTAQDLKIGVVNWARLLTESPQAEQVRDSMEDKFAARAETLQEQREKLEADVDRLNRDGAVMSQDARQKLEDSIRDQQRKLRVAQEEFSEDVQRAREEELQALNMGVRTVVNEYAQSQGYDLIIGDGVLFASGRVEITNQVLERLKDEM